MTTKKRKIHASSSDETEKRDQNLDVTPADSDGPVISYRRIIIRFVLVTCIMVGVKMYMSWQGEDVFVSSKESVDKRIREVICSDDYAEEREYFPDGLHFSTVHTISLLQTENINLKWLNKTGCVPSWCGRVVMDNIVSNTEAEQLLRMAKAGLSLGGSYGGASILDIHSGALSKGDKFVDIFRLMAETEEYVFSEADFSLYKRVKDKIHAAIAEEFGINKEMLYLTSPTFFSRMTSKPAQTIHDEYWHVHVDKETYGSFHYTSLLYLTTYNEDFTGGRFIFVDQGRNTTVEPKLGRVSFFTSGWENPHYVEKVRSGTRYAITVSFTCDPYKAIGNPTMR